MIRLYTLSTRKARVLNRRSCVPFMSLGSQMKPSLKTRLLLLYCVVTLYKNSTVVLTVIGEPNMEYLITRGI